jgi:putative hydrolase of the HAD superfamily
LKSQGYLLGIITDTANSIHAKLTWFERGGFGHVWDSIISSMELGTRKPDPEIYQACLQQLGLTPDQAVFVGHKASELEGARAIGMQTIAFNYEQDAGAGHFVERFADLLDVLHLQEVKETPDDESR